MFNPRFPHTLRVWRDTGVNSEGDPVREIVRLKKAVVLNDEPQLRTDGSFDYDVVDTIEFGYRTAQRNTSVVGDVEVSDYKIATPLFITPLDSDYWLELKDYDRTYWGKVVKKTSYNLGTNIWFNEVRG